jgi:phosphatidylglycerophosphate synthase
MLKTVNLHRAGKQPDWEKVPQEKRNSWQKLAATTNGIVTPANLISLTGAIVTMVGLVRITNDLSLTNVTLIVVGRLADLADGFAAQRTGTKSPLGEVVDATFDKILAFSAVVALVLGELAPVLIIGLILLHSAINSAISITAKLHNVALHPSREGKLAGAVCWGIIGCYILYNLVKEEYSLLGSLLFAVAAILSIAFIWYGWHSTRDYYKVLRPSIQSPKS